MVNTEKVGYLVRDTRIIFSIKTAIWLCILNHWAKLIITRRFIFLIQMDLLSVCLIKELEL
jgi:hypothetical protein